MKRFSLLLLILFLFIILWNSCTKNIFYNDIKSIKNETWHVDSVLHFEFNITDPNQYYTFYINIRNNTDFETQYFYVFLTSEFPNGYVGKDTLGFINCTPIGEWTGKGNGRLKDNQFLYKKQVRFPQEGVYKFSIQQGMREDNVKGIANFGMTLFVYKPE